MSTATLAGLLLVAVPLAFNASFALLGARFDYPDILRRPTDEVLERFRQGGTGLGLVWWAFALTAILFVPLVVLLSRAISDADGASLPWGRPSACSPPPCSSWDSSGGPSWSPTSRASLPNPT